MAGKGAPRGNKYSVTHGLALVRNDTLLAFTISTDAWRSLLNIGPEVKPHQGR